MSDATVLLTTTRNTLFDLIHPSKKVELEQKKPDVLADEAELKDKYRKTIIIFALVFFLFVLIKNAWLSDDSYITLRTVYNFVHGFGLTWNIDERVQTFTHPLWMFLLSGSYFCVSPGSVTIGRGGGVDYSGCLEVVYRLLDFRAGKSIDPLAHRALCAGVFSGINRTNAICSGSRC